MPEPCPRCGQPMPGDSLGVELERLRAWCRERGVAVVRGDCLRLHHAAEYLGRTEKTVRNLLALDALEGARINGRVYVPLTALARFVGSD